jgi:hypothetical protein
LCGKGNRFLARCATVIVGGHRRDYNTVGKRSYGNRMINDMSESKGKKERLKLGLLTS